MRSRWLFLGAAATLLGGLVAAACTGGFPNPVSQQAWELDNPLRPIPKPPLGLPIDLDKLERPPTATRVRLGRWLFFDRRLSSDGTVSCATCHQPEFAFSQGTALATGVHGRTGRRKALAIINLAIPKRPAAFPTGRQDALFWDGRAASLERQVLEPVANPNEMGSSEAAMLRTLSGIGGYRSYFVDAFGDGQITKDRVAWAIADYERTRMSGNAPFDRWQQLKQEDAVPEAAKAGFALFMGRAQCAHCHLANSFSGGGFHNTGIGWDRQRQTFTDLGRHPVTKGTVIETWPGTFKTPTLREVARHPPYMHDGSIATLHEVVEFYNRGANPNPYLSAFIRPLGLSPAEVDAIVAFLESLNGEGWLDHGPTRFPE
jgi:cytochrome c peroxidase